MTSNTNNNNSSGKTTSQNVTGNENIDLEMETGEVLSTENASNTIQTMKMISTEAVTSIGRPMAEVGDTFNYASHVDAEIGGYFSRPIKLNTYSWNVGSNADYTFDPWTLFLNDPIIRKKLDNYYLFRGDLVVTIQINGSPFHYGRLLVAYDPLFGYNPKGQAALTVDGLICEYSQRTPHVYVDPTTQDSIQLKIPYFYFNDYLDIPDGVYDDIGRVVVTTITDLAATSTSATTSVDVTYFVHAENVELSIPTAAVAQMKSSASASEYSRNGIISKPAAAVAAAAGKLKEIPFIAPFALATEIGANAIGGIASIFGYSQPVNAEPLSDMKRAVYTKSANTIGLSNISKLSLDPKQEVSVDPRVTKISNTEDCMTIQHIATRESYIGKFTWLESQSSETQLGEVVVCPTYNIDEGSATVVDLRQFTSLCFASYPFKYWGGSIVYKISLVASQYHRGRLRITYEPANTVYTPGVYNTNYTAILDLQKSRDIEFCVTMAQNRPYLAVGEIDEPKIGTPGNTTYDQFADNGRIYISVLNELASPDSTSPVEVLVFARAHKDFNVFGFKDDNDGNGSLLNIFGSNNTGVAGPLYSPRIQDAEAQMQSSIATQDLQTADDNECFMLVGQPSEDMYEIRARINHGDPIVSFRNLVSRWQLCENINIPLDLPTSNGQYTAINVYRANFPSIGGGTAFNNTQDKNFFQNGADYINPNPTCLLAYLAPGFAAWRGGLRRRYFSPSVGTGSTNVHDKMIYVQRRSAQYSNAVSGWVVPTILNMASGSIDNLTRVSAQGLPGFELTNTLNQNGVEVEFPYYNAKRFCSNSVYDMRGFSKDGSSSQMHKVFTIMPANYNFSTVEDALFLTSHVSAGDDFHFLWYTGAPRFGFRMGNPVV